MDLQQQMEWTSLCREADLMEASVLVIVRGEAAKICYSQITGMHTAYGQRIRDPPCSGLTLASAVLAEESDGEGEVVISRLRMHKCCCCAAAKFARFGSPGQPRGGWRHSRVEEVGLVNNGGSLTWTCFQTPTEVFTPGPRSLLRGRRRMSTSIANASRRGIMLCTPFEPDAPLAPLPLNQAYRSGRSCQPRAESCRGPAISLQALSCGGFVPRPWCLCPK